MLTDQSMNMDSLLKCALLMLLPRAQAAVPPALILAVCCWL